MKLNIIIFAIASFVASCQSNTKTGSVDQEKSPAGTPADKNQALSPGLPIQPVLAAYFNLKNALVKDDDVAAAAAGKELVTALDGVDKSKLKTDQSKLFGDIFDDAREHAEHIGANAGNIGHQREHFETLNQEMYELAKSAGGAQKLYVDHCPMYNKNKGANWLSETKEIQNPYLGKSMPTCGTVKEELN